MILNLELYQAQSADVELTCQMVINLDLKLMGAHFELA